MKNLLWKNILAILILATIGIGCKKFINSYPTPNNVRNLFAQLKDVPQTFTVEAGKNQRIIGAKGTRLKFSSNSFLKNGVTISNGNVIIKLIETPKAKDMLRNGVTTWTTSKKILHSGGAIKIEAFQNDEKIAVRNFEIDFKQDGPTQDSMQLFFGSDSNGMVSWFNDHIDTARQAIYDSSAYYFRHYVLQSFDWINCDKFYNATGPKTDVLLDVDGVDFVFGEAMAFVMLPAINANINLRYKNNEDATLFKVGAADVPIGMNAHFVIVGMHDSKFYYGEMKDEIISANYSRKIDVTEKSLDEIKALIDAL